MRLHFFGIVISIILWSTVLANAQEASKAERPNIILIMSDDMGYADISPYGGEIRTPNLQRLADKGVRFTQFYNTARCCPTRASLLTGLYPHQTGIGHMTNSPENPTGHDYELPGYKGVLNQHCVTIAEALKEAGYTTMMTGKWHLGFEKKAQWPLQRGFEKYYGIIPGASNYFKPEYPRGITYGNDTITITDEDYYTTDAFTDYGMQFIDESLEQSKDKPFFLYLAYNAPHWPLNAPQEDIDRYKGKYMKGWQQLREERYKRMKKMGLIDADWPLSPQDSRDWDSLSDEKKKEMDLRMAIYAAQVDRMDQNIGRLLDHLTSKGILDNTVIIFLDDNGACAEFDELGSGPAEQLETKQGYVLSYGRAWANASNTPFRKYKHWLHEGGISSPLIVHWPNGIRQTEQGKLIREYGFLPDIMATCLDLAGAEYPQTYQGNTIAPIAGKSLVPFLEGKKASVHTEPIFWEHEGNKAVRLGKYKLVQAWDKDARDNWELYDMEKDRTEMHNLTAQMPEKTKEMKTMWQQWADSHAVEPWDKIVEILNNK